MKKIVFSMAAGLLMLVACAQQQQKVVTDNEPTTITWIADKPEPNLQPHQLFPDVPDSLWNALGLQEGVRSSMSCFLLQTEGKQILFDAGLGAPSQAAEVLEMGADAVLINTAIARSGDPVAMAKAFKMAVECGRMAYAAKLTTPKEVADPGSPLTSYRLR